MGRARKQTAEYFPHFVTESRTKYALESKWGNDGYAFWFKLLEILCRSDGHYYDCSQIADKLYLTAQTKVSEETADEILDLLASMRKIDPELWSERQIIWCQTLVDNLSGMYAKRTGPAPKKPTIDGAEEPEEETPPAPAPAPAPPEPDPEPEGGGKKPKTRRRKASELSAEQSALFERFYAAYPKKVDPGAAERAWAKITPPPDEAMTEKIIRAVEAAKQYDSRFRDRQYIPNPASWLNAKGYLSDYTPSGGERQDGEHSGHSAPAAPGAFKPSGGFRGGGDRPE